MAIKQLLFGMGLGTILLVGLFFNIVAHEAGHWAVAEADGLKPEIHFFEQSQEGKASFYTPSFSVSYSGRSSPEEDAEIAFAGPVVNLIITLVLMGLYFVIPKGKRTVNLALIFIMLVLPSLISFIVNMLPFAGNDGNILINALR